MKKQTISFISSALLMTGFIVVGCSDTERSTDLPHEVKTFRSSQDANSWANSINIDGVVSNGADLLTLSLKGEADTLDDLSHLQVYIDIDNDKTTGYSDGPITFENVVYEISGADYMIEDDTLFKSTNQDEWTWEKVSGVTYMIKDSILDSGDTLYDRRFELDLNLLAGYNNSDIHIAVEPVDENWEDTNNFISSQTININNDIGKPDLGASPDDVLTTDDKYALAYMWHEEKLAYELYLELNKVQPANQFVNIANNSEIKHIAAVEDLVKKYDINITNLVDYEISYSETELRAMPTGVFAVDKIQNLYNILYAKGSQSRKDALEVGCMVEVVDIIDLVDFIETSSDKQDLVDTFEYLKEGSYKHYWAFDNGLKNLGISNGCCSVASFEGIDFCHPEYPKR